MKGITMCADCAYYNMKTHKCTRGATVDPDISKGHDVRFYVDCPLPDVQEVRHGRWESIGGEEPENQGVCCSECDYTTTYGSRFCPNCGARMDATDTNVGGKGGADNG